jgi:serine/threonine protein kinase
MYSDSFKPGPDDLPDEFIRALEEAFEGQEDAIDEHDGAGHNATCVADAVHAALDDGWLPEPAEHDNNEHPATPADRTDAEEVPTLPPKLYAPPEPVPLDEKSDLPILRDRVCRHTTGAMPATGETLLNRYLLIDRIKTAGMSGSFKAVDELKRSAGAKDPRIAIKVINKHSNRFTSALQALYHETEIGLRLTHANIAKVFEMHYANGYYFMTMEWLDGRSLASLLDANPEKPVASKQAEKIIRGIGHALQHAHEQGVVHADIKPGNIFITQNGQPKLIDFGIARSTGGPGSKADYSGSHANTPAWSSPEVLDGHEPAFSDDIFSLACVCYRLLSGHRPFGSMTAAAAKTAGLEPEPIPALTNHQWRVLRAALAFNHSDRPDAVSSFLGEYFRTTSDESQNTKNKCSGTEYGTPMPDRQRTRLIRFVLFGSIIALTAAMISSSLL